MEGASRKADGIGDQGGITFMTGTIGRRRRYGPPETGQDAIHREQGSFRSSCSLTELLFSAIPPSAWPDIGRARQSGPAASSRRPSGGMPCVLGSLSEKR